MIDQPSPERSAELLERARSGDRGALDALLRLHQPAIHAVCRRITGNDADALDATQHALIAMVRGLPAFDGRSRLSTWAYRIATNAALDELRRRRRRPVPVDQLPEQRADRADQGIDPGEQVADRDLIDRALGALSPEFRAAVVLRDLCQLDYAEVAEVLDIPPGTVRSRIARGRAQLADLGLGNQPAPDRRPTDIP